jgi:DNA-binding NtrC family response regulator
MLINKPSSKTKSMAFLNALPAFMKRPAHNGGFLIVDDEPDLCWAMEHILGLYSLPVTTVQRGGEALAIIRRQRIQLVFMDAKLPDMDGLALAGRMREIDPDLRIFLVSGYFYRDDHTIQQALDKGVISGFIAKPFHHGDILSVVSSLGNSFPAMEPSP